MQELLITHAIDEDGEIVTPEQAQKGENYYCPSCGDRLIVKQGEIKRHHFSHPANTNCSAEAIIHITAKRLIYDAVVNHQDEIMIHTKYMNCDHETSFHPQTFCRRAHIEYRLPTNHVADVAILDDNRQVILAVEIFNTHAVDEVKADSLGDAGIFWIELNADDVIADSLSWKSVRDNFGLICQECRIAQANIEYEARIESIVEKAESTTIKVLSDTLDIVWNQETYYPEMSLCYKCQSEIIYFAWDNADYRGRPYNPIPWTVSRRWIKSARRYLWVNTCHGCGSTNLSNNHDEWAKQKRRKIDELNSSVHVLQPAAVA